MRGWDSSPQLGTAEGEQDSTSRTRLSHHPANDLLRPNRDRTGVEADRVAVGKQRDEGVEFFLRDLAPCSEKKGRDGSKAGLGKKKRRVKVKRRPRVLRD